LWAFDVWGVMLVVTLVANAQHLHALAAPFIQLYTSGGIGLVAMTVHLELPSLEEGEVRLG